MNKMRIFISLLVLCLATAIYGGESTPNEVTVFDFQSGGKNQFENANKLEYVPDHATHGKTAGKAVLKNLDDKFDLRFGFDHGTNMQGRWGEFDQFVIDVFVEGGLVKASNFIRDPEAVNWESRYNADFVLKPGQRKLTWPVHSLMRERGGNGKPMDPATLQSFYLSFSSEDKDHPATIYLQNARLVKTVDEMPVAGMRKFSFGPHGSALMPGFTAVSKSSSFDAAHGFGWLPGANLQVDFDISEVINRHRPADDLCRHSCGPNLATFAVNLPNGAYSGWLMMAPPGFLFGNARYIKHRTVKANGQTVLDEEFTPEKFKAMEFAFQDAEDLPGDDLWEKYINVIFVPTRFNFTVTDGQLKLDFDAHGQAKWGCLVHALVVWPKDQDAAANTWLTKLSATRKEQYETQHVEKLPPAPPPYAASAADKARGYVRFVNSPDRDLTVNSTPTPEETATNICDLYAAPDQYVDGCFGIYPLHDCGTLQVAVSDLTGPGGAKIPAQDVQLQVVRYKDVNLGKLKSQNACYMLIPKYLDAIPAGGIPIKPGITRSFWAIVHVPKDAAAGSYTGQITLRWDSGSSDRVGLALTVWPIKLMQPDLPMGMFLARPAAGYLGLDPTGASTLQAWKEILDDAIAHGQTSIDPSISIPLVEYRNGKAEIDFTEGDSFMKAAHAAGLKQEICGYGIGTGRLNMHISPKMNLKAEAAKLGAADYGVVVRAYFDAVREHAKQNNWLPICWSTDDEFLVHPGGTPEKLAELHQALQQNAPGFHFGTYDSAQFEKHPELAAAYEKMLAVIDTWGCNIHSLHEAELTKKYGHRLWLYNQGQTRFTFGAYMFFAHRKYDVSGFFQWIYPSMGTYGLFYLASYNEAHYGVVYPSTRGLRTTPIWERFRAGCDDHRYMETAWNLVEKAKSAGQAQSVAALQALLDKMFSQLQFGKSHVYVSDGSGDPNSITTPAGLDQLRRNLAAEILKVQGAKP